MVDNMLDLSFCELRAKEIINVCDGRRLGRITDIVFSCHGGEVRGIVVPFVRRLFFSRNQEIFIPWRCINKIGEDVILVEIIDDGSCRPSGRGRRDNRREYCPPPDYNYNHNQHSHNDYKSNQKYDDCGCEPPHYHEESCCDNKKGGHGGCNDLPNCDRKCEKCMLFDCAYRWKDA